MLYDHKACQSLNITFVQISFNGREFELKERSFYAFLLTFFNVV